jgi:hypothetical protein
MNYDSLQCESMIVVDIAHRALPVQQLRTSNFLHLPLPPLDILFARLPNGVDSTPSPFSHDRVEPKHFPLEVYFSCYGMSSIVFHVFCAMLKKWVLTLRSPKTGRSLHCS